MRPVLAFAVLALGGISSAQTDIKSLLPQAIKVVLWAVLGHPDSVDAISRTYTVLKHDSAVETKSNTQSRAYTAQRQASPNLNTASRQVTFLYDPNRARDAISRTYATRGPAILNGTIEYEGLVDQLLGPRSLTLYLGDPVTPVPATQVSVNLDSGNHFTISGLYNRYYHVWGEVNVYLRTVGVADLRSGVGTFTLMLRTGDIDMDEEVGPGDFALLAAAFGKTLGEPGYLLDADLDKDEEVGPNDFSLLASRFGQFADELP